MKKLIIMLLLLPLLLTACAEAEPIERSLFAMDTYMTVRLWGDEAAADEICSLIFKLDAALDADDAESELGRLNKSDSLIVSERTAELLSLSVQYARQTDGAFDPTVRPYIRAWQEAVDAPPSREHLASLLPLVGTEHISLDGCTVSLSTGTELDLGGIAKGYTSQACIEALSARGVTCAVVSLGGNVQTLGSKPDGSQWAVGIADPNNPEEALAVVRFGGSIALVTSGDYQRSYEFGGVKYHHILDPRTGCPVDHSLSSVTILAQNGSMADAFSTALFVMGLDDAVDFWRTRDDFEAVFVLKDGSVLATQGAAPLLTGCDFEVINR